MEVSFKIIFAKNLTFLKSYHNRLGNDCVLNNLSIELIQIIIKEHNRLQPSNIFFIKKLNNTVFTIELGGWVPLTYWKQYIYEKYNIPVYEQVIIWGGKELDGLKTANDYNMNKENASILRIRSKEQAILISEGFCSKLINLLLIAENNNVDNARKELKLLKEKQERREASEKEIERILQET